MSYTPSLLSIILLGLGIYGLFTMNRREFGMSITAALISTIFQSLAGLGVVFFIRTVSGHIVMMILPGGHQIINILVYVITMITFYFVAKAIGRLVSSFFNARTREN